MRAGMIQTFLETNDSLTFGSSTAANNQRRLEVISTADQDRDGNGKKTDGIKKTLQTLKKHTANIKVKSCPTRKGST